MATEVTSIMRLMKDDSVVGGGESRVGLVTMDLLGGYQNLLDIKSGKLILQECISLNSTCSTPKPTVTDHMCSKFGNLNYPPVVKQSLNPVDDCSLDLKLVPSAPSLSAYQSVCTLDKVKSALERAEKESKRKRATSVTSKASSSPSSNSSSSCKDSEIDQEDNLPESFATGCRSCLMYVLISKSDPKCPRCKTVVPSPPTLKKRRIDLNISI